ncbi:MAG: hypothetical protein IID28_11035 [Planctomycetes bacterium]|nr:hypothetical protein [Planctomycetota bacterium]
MSFQSKVTSLQAYNLMLYRTALHPEFFRIEGVRRIEHGEYEFEAWIFRGGHALRFEHDGLCLTEIVSDQTSQLPERGQVVTLPCAGEKDHENTFGDNVAYVTSVQTEILTDHLYLGTYNEMLEHGRELNALMAVWTEDAHVKPSLSLLDIQRFAEEVHVQSYHLRPDCGLVLRSQSIFKLKSD